MSFLKAGVFDSANEIGKGHFVKVTSYFNQKGHARQIVLPFPEVV